MKKHILAALPVMALLLGANAGHARTDTGGLAGGPAIVLPDRLLTGQPIDAPVDVKFTTTPDTSVNLASLHIWVRKFVGWIDVTEQLLNHPRVRVGGWGIHLDGGVLPPGEHEVRLSFQDLKGRAVDVTKIIRIAQGNGSF